MERLCKYLKKTVFLIVCILAACSKVDNIRPLPGGPVEVGFIVGASEGETHPQTKTSMITNGTDERYAAGLSAKWEEGDEVALWAKNTAGSYILAKQSFKIYGVDKTWAAFTSTLNSPMPEGQYTYYCTYPTPEQISGTTATFTLPYTQDGKVSNGADIMVAAPAIHGPLKAVPAEDDKSGLTIQMERLMHQFRFWLPQGSNILGEPIVRIEFTLPRAAAGKFTADITNPTAPIQPIAGSTTNSIILDLAEPIGESTADAPHYACVAIFPSGTPYGEDDKIEITIYSNAKKTVLEPISLNGRDFLPGHSTPIKLFPNAETIEDNPRLDIRIGDNFIGEELEKLYITSGNTSLENPVYLHDVWNGERKNCVVTKFFLGTEARAQYDAIVSAIQSGNANYVYETENTLVRKPLPMSLCSVNGNITNADLGDVPYLLYEDFSGAKADANNDAYSPGTNSDMKKDGYLLNNPLIGWNASRYKIFEGSFIRINVRYQSGVWVVGRYCGRLDTPPLSYIKPGKSVKVKLEYDRAIEVPKGYNVDDRNKDNALYHIGVHSKNTSEPIKGVNSGDISTDSDIIYSSIGYKNEWPCEMSHENLKISDINSNSRIVFYPDTKQETSEFAANCVYYLYLDNIKIYITK